MKLKSLLTKLAVVGMLLAVLTPDMVGAVQIEPRSLTLGSSGASAVTTYAFSFKPGSTGNIGAIKFELCDSPLEAVPCSNAGNSAGVSFTSNGASILSQGGISGFSAGTGSPAAPTTNTFWITNGTPQNISSSTTVTVTFQNVRNPSTANKEFYAKVTTYSDSGGMAEVDFGGAAVSTANQLNVTGTMPESLVFCVGTSGTDCTNITGTAVDLGIFSPIATNTGSSVMSASTNAASGYAITLNAAPLSSGANHVNPMGTQSLNSGACAPSCASTTGVSQFGSNVVLNTSPAVGAAVSGAGTAAGSGGYNSANEFRFFTGDTVAQVVGVSDANLFTNSYIVNVNGSQAAGVYTTTMTYICTANF